MLALCGVLVVGCGDSGEEDQGRPIPSAEVAALERELDAVERRLDVGGGACGDIENQSRPDVQAILDRIPQDVDPEVRAALQRSFERLFELTATQCDEETTPTETEETPTLPVLPTETETTPTETEQQETQERPPGQQKPKKPKKNQGGGQGQGPPGGDDGGAVAPEDG